MTWLWIFLGGGLGSLARFAIAQSMTEYTRNFPWATLLANGLSCILLGAFTAVLLSSESQSPSWRFFWMIGFCGGFSTFSTFTSENFHLIQSGDIAGAAANVALSVLVCLICFYIGYRMATAL